VQAQVHLAESFHTANQVFRVAGACRGRVGHAFPPLEKPDGLLLRGPAKKERMGGRPQRRQRREAPHGLPADGGGQIPRIQLEACLFATTAMVFTGAALDLLKGIGVLQSTRLRHGLGLEGTFAAIIVFYILGNILFNRRYR